MPRPEESAPDLTKVNAGHNSLRKHASMDAISSDESVRLRHYDRPGPRYTSYPTAPNFSESFGEAELRAAVQRSNSDPIPRPLSLYVHVLYCSSPCFYCACNRVITRDRSRAAAYVSQLVREIALLAPLFDPDREAVQLHLGGGTPNFLAPHQIEELIDSLLVHFRLAPAATRDFSIELDPRFVQPGDISALAGIGFNRASLGVQDFDPEVQRAINRIQSVEETMAALEACRRHGFRSVNIDLIYGLPKQTLEGFGRTLDLVTAARPDRLAIYGYAHMPTQFRAQRQINVADLPAPEVRIELLQLAIERLGHAGYRYIGMDHFALPDDELSVAQRGGALRRNFMGYTTHAESDVVGFGVSAISHIGDSYSQNPRDLPAWQHAIDAGRIPVWRGLRLSADDLVRADVIGQLMCQGTIDIRELESRHNLEFKSHFAAELTHLAVLAGEGLVEIRPALIRATSRGRLLLRIIAECFDRYLHLPRPAGAKVAKAIRPGRERGGREPAGGSPQPDRR
jgi:oxygen-independent coproporphyrinogen-3 oxidase